MFETMDELICLVKRGYALRILPLLAITCCFTLELAPVRCSSDPLQETAKQLLQKVVDRELHDAQEDHSLWTYDRTTRQSGHAIVKKVMETRQGDIERLISMDGKPLTYEQQEKEKKLQAATVAFAQPGQMQTERDFNEQGEESTPLEVEGHYGRAAKKWFSFDMPVESAHPLKLLVTFSNDAYRPATVDVLVDGQNVGEQKIEQKSPEQPLHFTDVAYDLSPDLQILPSERLPLPLG